MKNILGKIIKFNPLVFGLLLLGWTFASTVASAITMEEAARHFEAMDWYTEEYPPYNFASQDGPPTGMAVDILMAAFKKVGVHVAPADIKIVPWNRSYKYIQKKPGTALFSMTYTPERQKIMKFVGPSIPSLVSVIAPKKNNVVARSPAELSQLRIGVVRDDIGDHLIRKLAVSDDAIKRKNSTKQLFYLLKAGRVDVVAYDVDVFMNAIRKTGEDPNQYEEIFILHKGQLGYAFHNSTDPLVLAPLQKALDELREDGTIDKIINDYRN